MKTTMSDEELNEFESIAVRDKNGRIRYVPKPGNRTDLLEILLCILAFVCFLGFVYFVASEDKMRYRQSAE